MVGESLEGLRMTVLPHTMAGGGHAEPIATGNSRVE